MSGWWGSEPQSSRRGQQCSCALERMASSRRRCAIAMLEMRWRDGPGGDEERGLGTGREQPDRLCRSLDGNQEDRGTRMHEVRSSGALRPAVTSGNMELWGFHFVHKERLATLPFFVDSCEPSLCRIGGSHSQIPTAMMHRWSTAGRPHAPSRHGRLGGERRSHSPLARAAFFVKLSGTNCIGRKFVLDRWGFAFGHNERIAMLSLVVDSGQRPLCRIGRCPSQIPTLLIDAMG